MKQSDSYTRTNTRGKHGIVRIKETHDTPNIYPTNPADRRRLNSAVNDKHVRFGWQAGECKE